MPDFPTDAPEDHFVKALTESQNALRCVCTASLGRGRDADEALQRTNLTLWKKSETWGRETPFLVWATAVAKFEIKGVIRDRNREKERMLFDSDIAEKMVDASAQIVTSNPDCLNALETCLDKVSPKNQRVLTDFYADGKTIHEISEAENRGLSAVKMQLKRLRNSLAECIKLELAKEAQK
ncbi:MAG: sigma-70 family RNA polymerase sigma factor [Verrucomicrobiales bacterium]|nr:sigma-70 family RNA polymerase sigma factor [Verrucomicrobiales bacterium]